MAPVSLTTCGIVSGGTNRNSGFLSTNFLISQGQAIRSTFAFSRVTHFMAFACGDYLCKPLPRGGRSPNIVSCLDLPGRKNRPDREDDSDDPVRFSSRPLPGLS